MSTPAILDTAVCVQRADETRRTAELLRNAGEEWAAVCYFYAAYHTVRGAILADPIFTSAIELSRMNPALTLADREVTRHQARIIKGQPREFGVNDLVNLLYPAIRLRYRRLHSASVTVRYGQGLGAVSLGFVEEDHEVIRAAFDAGKLVAPYN